MKLHDVIGKLSNFKTTTAESVVDWQQIKLHNKGGKRF